MDTNQADPMITCEADSPVSENRSAFGPPSGGRNEEATGTSAEFPQFVRNLGSGSRGAKKRKEALSEDPDEAREAKRVRQNKRILLPDLQHEVSILKSDRFGGDL